MTGHGAKFGRKQEEAIAALLSHRSVEEAARACAVGYKTLLLQDPPTLEKEPAFEAEYRAAKRATFGQSIARMHHLCGAAVSTLGKVMLDLDTPRFHKGPRRSAWPIQAADETQSAGGLGQERDESDHQTAAPSRDCACSFRQASDPS